MNLKNVSQKRMHINVNGPWYGMYRDKTLIPGRQYRVKFNYDAGSFSGGALAVGIFNMPSESLLAYHEFFSSTQAASVTFTAPSGGAIRIHIYSAGSTPAPVNMDYYVDNYTLEELLPAPPSYTEHNNGCITMSQSKWITYWVDSCYYEAVWPELNLTGEASYTVLDNQFYVHIPNAESSGWLMANVVPGQSNALVFEVDALSSGTAIISAEEYVNGNWVSLGGINIDEVRSYDFSIKPTQTQVKISIFGPVDVYYKKICVRIPVMKQEHVLVDVCPDTKDRYRFGFNGQEKVNEWAGLGNFMEFNERGYDSRVSRFLRPDPLHAHYPWNSNYAFAENSPIQGIDLEGLELLKVNSSIYQRKLSGSFTHFGVTSNFYTVEMVQRNIPKSLMDSKGNVKYNLGPPVGASGHNKPGPYLDDRPKVPGFFGAAATGRTTRDITSLKPNVVPGRSSTPANAVAPGANALQHARGIIQNQLNKPIWDAAAKEQDHRRAFYRATNLVEQSFGSSSVSGEMQADITNFITDGTLPPINASDREASLRQRKSIMDLAKPIMEDEKITIQPETQKTYESTSKDLKNYDVTK